MIFAAPGPSLADATFLGGLLALTGVGLLAFLALALLAAFALLLRQLGGGGPGGHPFPYQRAGALFTPAEAGEAGATGGGRPGVSSGLRRPPRSDGRRKPRMACRFLGRALDRREESPAATTGPRRTFHLSRPRALPCAKRGIALLRRSVPLPTSVWRGESADPR